MGSLFAANFDSYEIFFMPTSVFHCFLCSRLRHFCIGFIFPNPALYDNEILNSIAVCKLYYVLCFFCFLFFAQPF